VKQVAMTTKNKAIQATTRQQAKCKTNHNRSKNTK